jgi:NitT/TauT family transport system substrate-binding protein
MKREGSETIAGLAKIFARALAIVALILTMTGGTSSTALAQGQVEKPNITFGVLPITNYAVVYLALKEGLFQAEGLNVTPRKMGGANPIAALVGGDFDIAGITWTSFVLAYNRGIELVPVSEADRGVPGNAMYLVKADSPIKTTADLLGKKVGIVTVGGACDYLLNDDIRKKGLDYKAVAYTPIGVPDMAPTLLRGGIDAACIPEPILTAVKEQGGVRPIMDAFAGENNNWPIVGFSVTKQFADANPNTVAALRRALGKALKMANQNPDKLRELYPTYTTLKPEAASKITISFNPPESDYKQVKRIAELMERLGVIPQGSKLPPAIQ